MKRILLSILSVGGLFLNAQINTTESFENKNYANFTNDGFFRSKSVVVCNGTWSLIRNLYSTAPTGSTTFSSTSSNGGALTVSFQYRTYKYNFQTGPVNGKMYVEYSVDGGTTYTELNSYDLTSVFSCVNYTTTIPQGVIPAGADFKFRVRGEISASNADFYLILDNFSFSQSTLALSENTISNFEVYPNPASDFIFINKTSDLNEISIYDASGKLIKTQNSNLDKINISSLNSGNYKLILTDKKGKKIIKSIIKK